MERFDQAHSYKLIYVFSMPYESHKGLLKVGEATLNTDIKPASLVPNCHVLNRAATARINSYTKTASTNYKLEYTELAMKQEDGIAFFFKDKDVHKVLMNSGIHKVQPNGATGEEWFQTDLATVISAIKAVKNGKHSIIPSPKAAGATITPIDFCEEQLETVGNFDRVASFILYLAVIFSVWNLLDYLYSTFIAGISCSFTMFENCWLPIIVAVVSFPLL